MQRGAVELLEEATAALGDERVGAACRLLGGLARALDMQGQHERGAIVRANAVELARRLGDRPGLATVLVRSYWSRGTTPIEEILEMLTEARAIGEELGDTELQAEAMAWRVPAFVAVADIAVRAHRGGGAAADGRAHQAAVQPPRGRALRRRDRALRRAAGRGRSDGAHAPSRRGAC